MSLVVLFEIVEVCFVDFQSFDLLFQPLVLELESFDLILTVQFEIIQRDLQLLDMLFSLPIFFDQNIIVLCQTIIMCLLLLEPLDVALILVDIVLQPGRPLLTPGLDQLNPFLQLGNFVILEVVVLLVLLDHLLQLLLQLLVLLLDLEQLGRCIGILPQLPDLILQVLYDRVLLHDGGDCPLLDPGFLDLQVVDFL